MVTETEDFKDGFIRGLIAIGYSDEDANNEWEQHLATTVTKDVILGVVGDLVADFMYYNRKEDVDLPHGAIETALAAGVLTVDEIVAKFREEMESNAD